MSHHLWTSTRSEDEQLYSSNGDQRQRQTLALTVGEIMTQEFDIELIKVLCSPDLNLARLQQVVELWKTGFVSREEARHIAKKLIEAPE